MSKLIPMPPASRLPRSAHFQATAGGICAGDELLRYPAAVHQLNEGNFDHSPAEGLRLLAEISTGCVNGWFSPSDEETMTCWRWLVASLFIAEQLARHGAVDVAMPDGSTEQAAVYQGPHGAIELHPAAGRFSLAHHVERLAAMKFGADSPRLSAQLYQQMIDTSGRFMRLSRWGRESMAVLYDGLITLLQTEGMPATPTAH